LKRKRGGKFEEMREEKREEGSEGKIGGGRYRVCDRGRQGEMEEYSKG
jgi:hypothetical protein